jgi:hypothetical protein
MKYDDNHVRDFEGAVGICPVCGLKVTLDYEDRPKLSEWDRAWIVKCPHCETEIRCWK